MPPRTTWTPKPGEDTLLHNYWLHRGSKDTIYTEVGIAGRRKASHWRDGSSQRRLDGVRLITPTTAGIHPKKGTTSLFSRFDAPVELIEVKQGLSEAVVGQCLVGRLLFQKQYPGATVERTVALCKVADPEMQWVCEQPEVNIAVERIPNENRPGNAMTSRTADALTDARLAAIDPWRREHPGLYFTRVPVSGCFVSLLRLAEGPDLLARFDTRARFEAAVAGQPVDIIEVPPRLSRGVVGRVVSHALLLKKLYGARVGRRRILVGKADSAILWACTELGIEVEPLPELARG